MRNPNNNILIRQYEESDATFLAAIYFNTIHHINIKDYSPDQVNAWAPKTSIEIERWLKKWEKLPPIVAVMDNNIVGFAEFEKNGHIDCFYCHHEYQRCGVGSALLKEIEQRARRDNINKIFAEVSITAKPFFEAHGFQVLKQQTVAIRGQQLTNFVMEKKLT